MSGLDWFLVVLVVLAVCTAYLMVAAAVLVRVTPKLLAKGMAPPKKKGATSAAA